MLFPQFSGIIYPISVGDYMYQKYIGMKFGKWTIRDMFRKKYRSYFNVVCECGEESSPAAYHVINGFTSACKFCAPKKHGHYNTATNRAWSSARNRCFNPNNKNYKDYGGRGITMCERWNKFENFLKDMGEKPKGLTLDRINNDGNYEPGNCRWATYSQQNSNQRKRRSLKNIV